MQKPGEKANEDGSILGTIEESQRRDSSAVNLLGVGMPLLKARLILVRTTRKLGVCLADLPLVRLTMQLGMVSSFGQRNVLNVETL